MLPPARLLSWFAILYGLAALALAQTSTKSTPAAIPIALRSPYFNTWIRTLSNGGPDIGGVRLWNDQNVGWVGFIRVDGELYGWLGVGNDNKTTTLATYVTPTQTILQLRTGPVDMTVTFLSPVEPSDWAKQSFPFSYIAVDIASGDGAAHSVQLYIHVTGEWVSSDLEASIKSTTTRGNSIVYHTTSLSQPSSWAESADVAQDETLIFASANSNMLTSQTGASAGLRGDFDRTGALTNSVDSSDTPISPSYPAVAFALDLGNISKTPTPTPAVFALGILRDPVINYGRGSVVEARRPYWTTRWTSAQDALGGFIADYQSCLSRAQAFDESVMSAAREAASDDYADLVAMSVRQTFASMDITVGSSGNVRGFMKDIGGSRRVNPVDALYASFPAVLYFNASLGGILLEPLLESQSSSEYQHGFASPDLGSNYPTTALNNSDTTTLSVDSSASMLIMSWLYTQKSGDGVLIDTYYDLLKKWADYLVQNALRPAGFTTFDYLDSPNNSNLALKGIIGIYAMSQINKALESRGKDTSLTQQYSDTATKYYSDWQGLAFSSGRMNSGYDQSGSWALAYNLYPAMLMGADFIGQGVYDGQTSFYNSRLSSSGSNFGLGYDSNAEYIVKSHWTMFTAATVTSATVRDTFIAGLRNRTFMRGSVPPFSTTWDLRSGGSPPSIPDGRASPAQGAMLSLLALKLLNPAISFSAASSGASSTRKVNAGAIAGGVIGGLAAILGIILAVVLVRRRRRRSHATKEEEEPPNLAGVRATVASSPSPSTPMNEARSEFLSRVFERRPRTTASSELLSPQPFDALAASTPNETAEPDSRTITTATTATTTTTVSTRISEKRALQDALARQRSESNSTAPTSLPLLPAAAQSSSTLASPRTARSGGDLSYTSVSSPSPPEVPSVTTSSSLGGAPPDPSIRKQRYIPSNPNPQSPPSPSAGSPLSGGPGNSEVESINSSADHSLRAEVLELRRQMAEIQARTMMHDAGQPRNEEPPPSYDSV